jgi:hypothetical protein
MIAVCPGSRPLRDHVTLSLGRVLWWYGEDALWPEALELSPATVANLVLGTIEHLEGRPDPPRGATAAAPTCPMS